MEPNTPTQILEKTIEKVESTASPLKKVIEDNFYLKMNESSLSNNRAFLEVEKIARQLEEVAMDARGALRDCKGLREHLDVEVDIDLSPERDVSPDNCVPFDWDNDGGGNSEHSVEIGYDYDSDWSPKHDW